MRIPALMTQTWVIPKEVTEGIATAKQTVKETVNDFAQAYFPYPPFHTPASLYDRFISRAPKVLEFFPDCWNILSSLQTLSELQGNRVPRFVRLVVAGLGVFNLVLVPAMVVRTLHSLWMVAYNLATGHVTGLIEGIIRVVHLSALDSVLMAVGAHGFLEFFKQFKPQAHQLNQLMESVFPYVGCILRISMIPQVMDISSGMTANAYLSHILKPMTLKERCLPIHVVHSHYCGTPFMMFTTRGYERAVYAMGTIRGHENLYRKVYSSKTPLSKTIETIEGRMNSWMLPLSWIGCLQATRLARQLEAKSVVHVHNQMLGLTGNCFAIFEMISIVNVATAACFAIMSSLCYMLQTAHRQRVVEQA